MSKVVQAAHPRETKLTIKQSRARRKACVGLLCFVMALAQENAWDFDALVAEASRAQTSAHG